MRAVPKGLLGDIDKQGFSYSLPSILRALR